MARVVIYIAPSTSLASLLPLAEEAILFVAGVGEPATAVAKPGIANGGSIVLEQYSHASALRDEVLVPGRPVDLMLLRILQ